MRRRILPIAVLTVLWAASSGCHRFRAEVTVTPEGGGRRVTTAVPDLRYTSVPEIELYLLLGLGESGGWLLTEVEGRRVWVRDLLFDRPDDWSAAGGDLALRGGIEGGDGAGGLVNTVALVSLDHPEYGRCLEYSETLDWSAARRQITRAVAERFAERCAELAPGTTPAALGELKGLFRAYFLEEWERTGLGDDLEGFAARVAGDLRRDASGLAALSSEDIQGIVDEIIQGEDEVVEQVLDRDLVGVGQAFGAVYELDVRMPGEIVETDGELVEPGLVRWEIGLSEPVDRSVRCRVLSRLGGD